MPAVLVCNFRPDHRIKDHPPAAAGKPPGPVIRQSPIVPGNAPCHANDKQSGRYRTGSSGVIARGARANPSP